MLAGVIGLIVAVVVLGYWLAGHWLGRGVVFTALCGFGLFTAVIIGEDGNLPWAIGWVAFAAAAWPLSGIPFYVRRHRAKAKADSLAGI